MARFIFRHFVRQNKIRNQFICNRFMYRVLFYYREKRILNTHNLRSLSICALFKTLKNSSLPELSLTSEPFNSVHIINKSKRTML